MTSSLKLEVKMEANMFLRPEMNQRKVTMKYGGFVGFICQDSAEIWGFRYGLKLVIGTLKIVASTGVFLRVVVLLKTLL